MKKQMVIKNTSLLLDVEKFAHAQRVGNMLTTSTMVPDHFRNNLGNCVIALNYADRVGLDPFMVMQKMYIIHGKPAIETQLQIALFNNSESYSHIKYKLSGEGDSRQCIAYATDLTANEEVEGPAVSIDMSKKEGWYGKNGSKWKTMPELMLRYRAAAFFIRLYAPETTLGLATKEEAIDIGEMKDITPQDEIDMEANSGEMIDINMEEPAQVEAPKEPGPMTDEEKTAIEKQEKALADSGTQSSGPDF